MKNNYKRGEKDTRPWGKWEVIDAGEGFVVKRIEVNAGEILSLQRHRHRSEHWIVVGGEGVVTLGDKKHPVKQDDHFYIPVTEWHRMENPGTERLVFVEVQTGDNLDENDIERREDKYSR